MAETEWHMIAAGSFLIKLSNIMYINIIKYIFWSLHKILNLRDTHNYVNNTGFWRASYEGVTPYYSAAQRHTVM